MARYLVTGGAGFIGSNLVRALIQRGDAVRVVDDFSTGRRENLAGLKHDVDIIEGSITDRALLDRACHGMDYCLHQAALSSVPRSIASPADSNRVNVEGTLNVLLAARDAGVRRVVIASSSSVYGNATVVPVPETHRLAPISPYGVSKASGEMYAQVFSGLYKIEVGALRYFNVFGPRQDPHSPYSAVIPLFIRQMLAGERPTVNGTGAQSRDFTYVDNVVSANLKACAATHSISGAYNIACGHTYSILELVADLNMLLGTSLEPEFRPPRAGDIERSCADIGRAHADLNYEPLVSIEEGLRRTVAWYAEKGRP